MRGLGRCSTRNNPRSNDEIPQSFSPIGDAFVDRDSSAETNMALKLLIPQPPLNLQRGVTVKKPTAVLRLNTTTASVKKVE